MVRLGGQGWLGYRRLNAETAVLNIRPVGGEISLSS